MTSYQMRLTDKQRVVGRIVLKVQRAITNALVQAKAEAGLTQQALAEKLEVDRSAVNRRVLGKTNLTLRSLAELVWALDMDIEFALVPRQKAGARALGERKRSDSWRQRPLHSRSRSRLQPHDPLLAVLLDRTETQLGSKNATNDNWRQLSEAAPREAA